MNTILLQPTDVLFFRDGRPMGGASSGHGAVWPLPSVINHAFHVALHRASFGGVHEHRRGRSGDYQETRDRKFGSLVTAGPSPVDADGHWFFPRPADAAEKDSTTATLRPTAISGANSLPSPLTHAVGNQAPPSKDSSKPWWSTAAWNAYLHRNGSTAASDFKSDSDFADPEHTYGIGIDSETGTQNGEQFYSANYLRLQPGWRLGTFAEAKDKDFKDQDGNNDLVAALLNGHGREIIIGGQQRLCTATLLGNRSCTPLPLPLGLVDGFQAAGRRRLVKWILVTPAIFPQIVSGISKRGTERKAHPGGWLPTWICPESGKVLLQTISEEERKRRRYLNAAGKGYESRPDIPATLVAAVTGKPLPVTGYALPNATDPDRLEGGAKSTHLAVPAGSVYYFECDTPEAAQALANALNWHGSVAPGFQREGAVEASVPLASSFPGHAGSPAPPSQAGGLGHTIRNRRSTLMGEKGFGLGVCGTWDFHPQGIHP